MRYAKLAGILLGIAMIPTVIDYMNYSVPVFVAISVGFAGGYFYKKFEK